MKIEIVQHNGLYGQLDMTMEECAELIQACNRYKRAMGKGQATMTTPDEAMENLITEIAHVQNCIDSLKFLLPVNNRLIRKRISESDKKCIKVKRVKEGDC